LEEGVVQDTVADVGDASVRVTVGADAVVPGVAPAGADQTPVPAAFTAATSKRYGVPLVSPVTVAVAVVVPVVAVNTVQVAPALLEYWIA
jgi:hypothetical protein